MVTKLKKNDLINVIAHFLAIVSFYIFWTSDILRESVQELGFEKMEDLVTIYQRAGYVKIITVIVFAAMLALIFIYSKAYSFWKQTLIMFLVAVALEILFWLWLFHLFVYPIWYGEGIGFAIVRNALVNTILAVPGIFIVVRVLKSTLYGILENVKKRGEMENEEKRIALEKMRKDLLTNISHDLRTPLTSILSYVDILKSQELSEESAAYVEIIDKKAGILRNMVDDIVYLSKLTSGNMPVTMDKINLKCFLEQVLFEWKADNEQIEDYVNYEATGGDAFVEIDGNKLYRVFQNLLDNVMKYKKEDSLIEIRYENTETKYARIEIKNEASYPMKFQGEDMLERFARADKARKSEGHGLGLAIADELVKLCKAEMAIKVEGEFFIVQISLQKLPAKR